MPAPDELGRQRAALDRLIRARVSRLADDVVRADAAVPEREIGEVKSLLDLRAALAQVAVRAGRRRWLVIAAYAAVALLTGATLVGRVRRTDISLVARASLVGFQTAHYLRDNGDRLEFGSWRLDADSTASSDTRPATLTLELLPEGTSFLLGNVESRSARDAGQVHLTGPQGASFTLEVAGAEAPRRLDTLQQIAVDSPWTFTGTPVAKVATLPAYIGIRGLRLLDPATPDPLALMTGELSKQARTELETHAHVEHATVTLTSLRPPRVLEFGTGDMLALYGVEGRLNSVTIDSQGVALSFTGSVTGLETARDTSTTSLMPTWYDILASQSFLTVLFTVTTTIGALAVTFLRWWPGRS